MSTLKSFYIKYKYAIIAWLAMGIVCVLGYTFGIDKHVIGGVIILVGVIGQAFAALICLDRICANRGAHYCQGAGPSVHLAYQRHWLPDIIRRH